MAVSDDINSIIKSLSKKSKITTESEFTSDFIDRYEKEVGSWASYGDDKKRKKALDDGWSKFKDYKRASNRKFNSDSEEEDEDEGKKPKKKGLVSRFLEGTGTFLKEAASTQIVQNAPDQKDYVGMGFLDTISKGNFKVKDLVVSALDEVGEQLERESKLRSEINTKTTLSGDLSKKLREDIREASISATQFGISMSDLGDIFTELVSQSGKFNLINQETFENAAPTIRAFLDSSRELGRTIAEFEKVGVGTNKTIDLINTAGTKSIGLGLSGKKVVADITSQIGKLNEYGFSKGVEGLTRMVQKSLEFKMNLDSVFSIADKVMNPEGALDLVANLQVLGGAMGDFADPIKLMYDATNNVEGIQDALIGAAGSLATYNQEQGKFEITGLNLRRAKEMAQQLGISYQELAKGAISAAERSSAASAIMASGLQISDDDKEFLTNLSHMEGGQMVISIPKSLAEELGKPTQIALDQLDATTAKSILEFQKEMAAMSPEDIARDQLTTTEKIMRDVEVMAQYTRVQAAKLIDKGASNIGLKDFYEDLEKNLKGFSDQLTERKKTSSTNVNNTNTSQAVNTVNNYINDMMTGGVNTNIPLFPPPTQTNVLNTTNASTNNTNQTTSVVTNGVSDGLTIALKPFMRSPSLGVTIDKMDLNSIKNLSNGVGQKVADQTATVSNNIVNTTTDKLDEQINKTVAIQTDEKKKSDELNQTNNQILTSINKQSDEAKKLQEYFDNTNVNYKENLDVSKKSSEIVQSLFTVQKTDKQFTQNDLLRKDIITNSNNAQNNISSSFQNFVEKREISDNKLLGEYKNFYATNTSQQNDNLKTTKTEEINQKRDLVQNEIKSKTDYLKEQKDSSDKLFSSFITDQKNNVATNTISTEDIIRNQTLNNTVNNKLPTTITAPRAVEDFMTQRRSDLFSANVEPLTPKNINVNNKTNINNTKTETVKNNVENPPPKNIEVTVKTSGNAMDIWASAVANSLRGFGEIPDYLKQEINS